MALIVEAIPRHRVHARGQGRREQVTDRAAARVVDHERGGRRVAQHEAKRRSALRRVRQVGQERGLRDQRALGRVGRTRREALDREVIDRRLGQALGVDVARLEAEFHGRAQRDEVVDPEAALTPAVLHARHALERDPRKPAVGGDVDDEGIVGRRAAHPVPAPEVDERELRAREVEVRADQGCTTVVDVVVARIVWRRALSGEEALYAGRDRVIVRRLNLIALVDGPDRIIAHPASGGGVVARSDQQPVTVARILRREGVEERRDVEGVGRDRRIARRGRGEARPVGRLHVVVDGRARRLPRDQNLPLAEGEHHRHAAEGAAVHAIEEERAGDGARIADRRADLIGRQARARAEVGHVGDGRAADVGQREVLHRRVAGGDAHRGRRGGEADQARLDGVRALARGAVVLAARVGGEVASRFDQRDVRAGQGDVAEARVGDGAGDVTQTDPRDLDRGVGVDHTPTVGVVLADRALVARGVHQDLLHRVDIEVGIGFADERDHSGDVRARHRRAAEQAVRAAGKR